MSHKTKFNQTRHFRPDLIRCFSFGCLILGIVVSVGCQTVASDKRGSQKIHSHTEAKPGANLTQPPLKGTTNSLDVLKIKAAKGDAMAQCNLGYRYDMGRGVPRDYAEAIKWYRKSAKKGCATAQYNLGGMQVSLPVQPGNSGGALVDEHGNVVGVVSAKMDVMAALESSGSLPENVNYAVKGSLLLAFLQSVQEAANSLKEPQFTARNFADVVNDAQRSAAVVLVYNDGGDPLVPQIINTDAQPVAVTNPPSDQNSYHAFTEADWKAILIAADQGDAKALNTLSRFRREVNTGGFSQDDPVVATLGKLINANDQWLQELFPDIHPDKTKHETIGTKLFFENHPPEVVITNLLREAMVIKMPALFLLRMIYFGRIDGYPECDQRIRAYYQMSADEGSPRSKLELGKIYGLGAGIPKDMDKAIQLLENNPVLLDGTDDHALSVLQYLYNQASETNKAEQLCKDSAERGQAWGHYNYAVKLRNQAKYAESFQHFSDALKIEPKDWETVVNLGQCYIQGWGTDVNLKKGFEMYKQAADEGNDPVAMFVVGNLYLDGTGVEKSESEAKRYHDKAAALGFDSKDFFKNNPTAKESH